MQEKIKTFDNKIWDKQELLDNMYDDDFYYGYLGKNALSSSSLKMVLKSPKTYKYVTKYGQAETQPLRDGKLFHTLILEPNKIDTFTFVDCKTKAAKEYKLALEEHQNVFTTSELRDAERLADAILKNNEATGYFNKAQFEIPEVAMIDGIPFRAKADILRSDCIVDLKTTTGINEFRYSADKYGYDLQAYLYTTMFNLDEFVFITIDKGSCDIGIFECSKEFYQRGKDKLEQGIANYKYFFGNDEVDLNQYVLRGIL